MLYRYHVGRQTLYTNFHFTRARNVDDNWEDMDQGGACELVQVRCVMENFIDTVFVVGKHWPLSTLRQELSIALDMAAPEEYTLFVAMDSVADIKVKTLLLQYLGFLWPHPCCLPSTFVCQFCDSILVEHKSIGDTKRISPPLW
jgi:hypothetical protein